VQTAQTAMTCETIFSEDALRPTWQSVGPHIWLHTGQADALSSPHNRGHISNIIFVLDTAEEKPKGWLVGSGPDAATGRALACHIKQSLGITVTDLVSTRAYPESVLGAAGLPDVRHWALPNVQAAMTARCERCLNRLELAINSSAPLVPSVALPTHLIVGGQLGPFEVMAVEVQAHESVALLRHRNSDTWLLPGVVWGNGLAPQGREADADHLLDILARLALRQPTRIIPEQGGIGGGGLIVKNINYWNRLLESVNKRWRSGENSDKQATGLLPVDAENASPQTILRDQLNAQRVWQKVENESFDKP
jgi:hypothetical protein